MENKMQIVKVQFAQSYGQWGGKTYDYNTFLNVKEGDLVICDTIHGPAMAKVHLLAKTSNLTNLKLIFQKVDTEALIRMKEQAEREEMLNLRMTTLLKKMESRRKNLSTLQIYEEMAKQDPGMEEILSEYKGLMILKNEGKVE